MDTMELSFTMAKRLKELREKHKLSHMKLGKELFNKYKDCDDKKPDEKRKKIKTGSLISKDSLMQYEVSDINHTKAFANDGMSVENLRFLADFYNVSADYILGLSDISSRNETIQNVNYVTGISQHAIIKLKIEKECENNELSNFISYVIEHEKIDEFIKLVGLIKEFSASNEICILPDADNIVKVIDVYEILANQLFYEIIKGYSTRRKEYATKD